MRQTDFLQQCVAETFAELGADAEPSSIIRTILIRDQHFVGYRFRCEGMEAVWRSNGNVVAFFDERGKLLKAVRTGCGEGQRAA